jgi:hypothetical protein
MAQPTLSAASFPKLTKTGTSTGTVTGTNFTTGASVSIETKNNAKKQWGGTVGSYTGGGNIWNASVQNTQWQGDPESTDETVAVVVTNSDNQTSAPPTDTTSTISPT